MPPAYMIFYFYHNGAGLSRNIVAPLLTVMDANRLLSIIYFHNQKLIKNTGAARKGDACTNAMPIKLTIDLHGI